MKIAYLANVRIPSERAHAAQIVHMAQAFAQTGVALTLFANTRTQSTVSTIGSSFGIQPQFSLVRLRYGLFIPGSKIAYYVSELIFSFHFLFTKKPKQYDVIYSRDEWVLAILSFFLPIQQLVWESHEAHHSYAARRLLRKRIKTVVISEGIYDAYKAYGYSADNFLVAHDAIDESFFEPVESTSGARQRLGLPTSDHIVMYIGGLAAWKGVETFCEAASLTEKSTFVVMGGTDEEVLAYKKQYPLVRFLGPRPYAELKNNQQAADILVIPNSARTPVSTEYTSPLKLFAHMASGKPLIVSDVPSITRVTGSAQVTVFKADNARSLAEAVEAVRTSPTPPIVSKILASRYTWTNRARSIVDFIL